MQFPGKIFSFLWRHKNPLLVLTLFVLVYAAVHNPTDVINSSVMIVRNDERSGGSGVILESSSDKSTILTNAHVCEVVRNGGLVVTSDGKKHSVTSYKQSELYDLCLVTVGSNLGYNTQLASHAPSMFENATIAGHPHLLPTVLTKGHFSGNMIIEVMTGFRECTDDDKNSKDPITGLFCALVGKLPVVKRYESVLVTATIMPGSSGSGVFTDSNELAGLAFAGSGDLGYAFTVPFAFVYDFVNNESHKLEPQYPNNTLSLEDLFAQMKVEDEISLKVKKICVSPENQEQAKMCQIINRSLL